MNLEKKKEIVEDLHEKFSRSKLVILAEYKGLDVKAMNDLRRSLREDRIECRVVKNKLLARASEGTHVSLIKESFKGPNAVVLSYEDPVSSAKRLTQFAKENERLKIKIGVMRERVLDAQLIKTLAVLPSREQLLGKLLSTMVGVPTALVNTLSAIPRGLVNVLCAIKDKKAEA